MASSIKITVFGADYSIPNPDKPEMKIEDLWYRFALSFIFKSIEYLNFRHFRHFAFLGISKSSFIFTLKYILPQYAKNSSVTTKNRHKSHSVTLLVAFSIESKGF